MNSYLSSFCTYIRVPEYVANYMRCEYGGETLTLSEFSPYYGVISKSLVENVSLSTRFSALSYTQRAVGIATKERNDKLCAEFAVPKQKDLKCLLAVYIPSNIYRKAGVDRPSQHYQLTRRGARQFRELARQEFWSKFFEYERYQESVNGDIHNHKRSVLMDFMRDYGINIDCLDTLYRHRSRNEEKIKSSQKRQKQGGDLVK